MTVDMVVWACRSFYKVKIASHEQKTAIEEKMFLVFVDSQIHLKF